MDRSLEHARGLLERARGDLATFECLSGDPAVPFWSAGFHAQQAVEKAIKAAIAFRGVEYPFTHDIQRLLEILKQEGGGSPPEEGLLPSLTPYAVAARYDDALDRVIVQGMVDVSRMLLLAQTVIGWAGRICEPESLPPSP